jgi:hypothetical protein
MLMCRSPLRQCGVFVTAVLLASACSGGITTVDTAGTTTTIEVPTTTQVPTTTEAATTTTQPPTTTEPTTTTEPPPLEWNLLAGGDVLMDRTAPAGIDPFAGLVPTLASADLAMVNVEMAISDRGTAVGGKQFTFRAPPVAAEIIGAAGIDVATLANNHARDYGADALLDTVSLLQAAGVTPIGAGPTSTDAFTPAVLTVGPIGQQITVAFLGAALVVPGGFAATSDRAGVADGNDRDRVLANVRVAAAANDVVIVTLHWGIERDTCPSDTHRRFAEQILEAGATAVVGHHPHVLQPVEFADGKAVAYSLGNFAWHPRGGITGDTGLLELKFVDTDLVDVVVHPHVLDGNGAPVPITDGSRFDRINDIVSGDCEKDDPPPVTYAEPTTSVAPTTTGPTTTGPTTTGPTTTGPTTSVAPTTAVPTTAAPADGADGADG